MSICKRLAALAAALCLSAGLAVPALADVVQPTADFYVADYADVLSDSTERDIVEKNDYLYYESGAQIVVVTVQDTGGVTLEEYGYQLANSWGIGSAEKDNGVLLLLSIGGQDYQCMQGAGLEDQLPTSTLSRILQDDLEPDFAAGDYDAGVQKTFSALYGQVCGVYGLDPAAAADFDASAALPPQQERQESGSGALSVIMTAVGAIVFLALVIVLIAALSGASRRRYGGPSYGGSGFFTGMMVGNALGSRRRRRPPPPPGPFGGPPPRGPRPPRPPRSGGGFFRSGGGGSFRSGGSFRGGGFRGGGGGGFRGGGAGRGH